MSGARHQRFTIELPHPDIENNVERRPLEVHVTVPQTGIGEKTGLIVAIDGYGSHPGQMYPRDKLRPYLADKHDCIVIGVTYFGCLLKSDPETRPLPDFFVNLERAHGVSVGVARGLPLDVAVRAVCVQLAERGVTRLDPSCRLLSRSGDEYHSFGFLPALDILTAVNETIRRYPIDTGRLFVLGTSYGAHIALLLGKLAPRTFRMIVDNSGFCRPVVPHIYGHNEPRRYHFKVIAEVEVKTYEWSVWSPDPRSPRYFTPWHDDIRNVLVAEHRRPSRTRHYCYHFEDDHIAPTADKERFSDLADGVVPVALTIVRADGLDGRLFKVPRHGMKASLRGLFDHAYGRYLQDTNGETEAVTDFDLESRYRLDCGSRTYDIAYSRERGIVAALV